MKRRIISLVLAFVMLLAMLPTTAFAANQATYSDVAATAWYYDAVSYVSHEGLMSGIGNRAFAPNATLTRAQLCQILYNKEGQPAAQNNPFSDVSVGAWYNGAVSWAAASHIVDGVGNNQFNPDNPVTREQMVTILYRYAAYKDYSLSEPVSLEGFSDADLLSEWAKTQMQWAVGEGIINGTSATTISPQGTATRAQAAAMLMRFCQRMDAKAEFYAKDMDDFSGEEIINFDESEETNFAVLEKDTVVSESSGEVNQLTVADEQEGVYVFSNADQAITGLKPGDVLYHTYGEGADDYLLLKVETIEIEGGTVTITEGEGELSDYFQYIDLDMEVPLAREENGTASVSGPASPVLAAAAQSSLASGGTAPMVAKDVTIRPGTSLKFGFDGDCVKMTGSTKLTLEIKVSYDRYIIFFDVTEISVCLKTETTVQGKLTKSAKKELINKKILDTEADKEEAGILDLSMTEEIYSVHAKVEARCGISGSLSGKITTENGVKYRDGQTYPIREYDSDIDTDIGGDFNFKVGISVFGGVRLIKVLRVGFDCEAGAELDGKVEVIHTSTLKEEKHICAACVSGAVDIYLEGGFKATVGLSPKKQKTILDVKPFSVTFKFGDFYISDRMTGVTDTIEFGWGKCPYKQYLVTVTAQDESGSPLKGVMVWVQSDSDENFASQAGETDSNGIFQCYCDNGSYTISASLEDYQDTERKTVAVNSKAVNATVKLSKKESTPPSTSRVTRTTQLDIRDMPTTANIAEGWSWNKETKTLILDNVNFEVTDKPEALICETATIILKGNNSIVSAYDEYEDTCAVYCMGDLVIEGDGSLLAADKNKIGGRFVASGIGISNHGSTIYSHSPGSLTINSGNITAIGGLAECSMGVEGIGSLIINGGSLTATAGNGLTNIGIELNALTMKSGSLTATTTGDYSFGIRLQDLTMNGGSLKATCGQTAENMNNIGPTAILLSRWFLQDEFHPPVIHLSDNISIKVPEGGKSDTGFENDELTGAINTYTYIVDASNKPAKEVIIE